MGTLTAITGKTSLQVVQQGFHDFANGNIAAVINSCAHDVVWGSYKNPGVSPSGLFYGKEGVQEFFTLLAEKVNLNVFEPKQFICQDDDVVVLGHQAGIVKATEKMFDHDWAMHFHIQDGLIRNFFAYVDTRDQSQAFS
jgi:uncharacterized protein